MTRTLCVAGDAGPRATVAALAGALAAPVVSRMDDVPAGWAATLRNDRIDLIICGTSDSDAGREFEEAAQRAASTLGIAVVQIEDYPGNFRPGRGTRSDLLVADGEFSARLAVSRWADRCPATLPLPTPRYDSLRIPTMARTPLSACEPRAVLWVGQPETGDSQRTLALSLPHIARHNCELLFRAHPRDAGYMRGDYAALLGTAGMAVRDVSALDWQTCLRMGPTLVLTQFSSLAVEAGFFGIPALHVLCPEIGGSTLRRKKGYAIPPWCLAGASFLIRDPTDAATRFAAALTGAAERQAVMRAFDEYFCVDHATAPILLRHLYNSGLADAPAP